MVVTGTASRPGPHPVYRSQSLDTLRSNNLTGTLEQLAEFILDGRGRVRHCPSLNADREGYMAAGGHGRVAPLLPLSTCTPGTVPYEILFSVRIAIYPFQLF